MTAILRRAPAQAGLTRRGSRFSRMNVHNGRVKSRYGRSANSRAGNDTCFSASASQGGAQGLWMTSNVTHAFGLYARDLRISDAAAVLHRREQGTPPAAMASKETLPTAGACKHVLKPRPLRNASRRAKSYPRGFQCRSGSDTRVRVTVCAVCHSPGPATGTDACSDALTRRAHILLDGSR